MAVTDIKNALHAKFTQWKLTLFALVAVYYCRKHKDLLSFLLSKMFGFGSAELTSAKETVPLRLKNPADKKHVPLKDLVQSVMEPVRLNPLMFTLTGHLQTMWVATGRGRDASIHYKRRIFVSDHATYPGEFSVDFVVPTPATPEPRDRKLPPRTHLFAQDEWQDFIDADSSAPLLITLHGLSGGSHEQYVRQCLQTFTGKAGGWQALVINARGCCYTRVTGKELFNARATWDIRQFVKWARQQWPKRRMFAMGFSLGANILCNYIGEEGEACELEAGVLVGNPWNLDVSNAILCSSYIGLHVYQAAMGAGLRKLFERHVDALSQNPKIDVEKVRKSTYLWEWDRLVQCASWGYPTESAYYRDASSVDAALNIKIPVLAIGAKDDPICSDLAVPYHEFTTTPYIVMCATTIGGHLGWFEYSGERWSDKMIYRFLNKFVTETHGADSDESSSPSAESTLVDISKPTFEPLRRRLYFRHEE